MRKLCRPTEATVPVRDLHAAAETLASLGLGEKSLLPDIFTLMKLCLTLPAFTATAERSFSTLRRVKT